LHPGIVIGCALAEKRSAEKCEERMWEVRRRTGEVKVGRIMARAGWMGWRSEFWIVDKLSRSNNI
jgi:hypothetical protein